MCRGDVDLEPGEALGPPGRRAQHPKVGVSSRSATKTYGKGEHCAETAVSECHSSLLLGQLRHHWLSICGEFH
jgi:hypothetical protein